MEIVDDDAEKPQPGAAALEGRAALVTGAAGGIGAAIALAFAGAGAHLAVADIDGSQLAEVAERCRALGAPTVAVEADVTTEAGAAAVVDAAISQYGRLDAACNNVGATGPTATLDELDVATWEQIWRINVTSTMLCMRREIAHMRFGGGSIVNVASTGGLGPLPRLPAYTAAKHAVVGLTKAAAIDHGADRIRVNAVCPGPTDTPLLRAVVGDDPAALAARAAATPLGRIGRPHDVAAAVLWLSSDAAAFVTGETLRVDGGRRT